jgi:hypothetical protein
VVEAESCFLRAIKLARRQNTRLLEIRSACGGLARRPREQSKPTYGRFGTPRSAQFS